MLWYLETIKTPIEEINNPKKSKKENCSPRIKKAITAEIGGIKKNNVEVWFALLRSKSHIKIKNAPNEIANICHDIAIKKLSEKLIK